MSQTLKDEKVFCLESRNLLNVRKVIGDSGMVELDKSIRESKYSYTVKGENFAYFSFTSVLGGYDLKKIYKATRIQAYEVVNDKEATAGYLVIFKKEDAPEGDLFSVVTEEMMRDEDEKIMEIIAQQDDGFAHTSNVLIDDVPMEHFLTGNVTEEVSTEEGLEVKQQLPKIKWDGMGVSIFYSSEKVEYTQIPKVLFADKKFRLIALGHRDYFCSVKWKAMTDNAVESRGW